MAGDWIKVEKSTARKPEVLRLADLLEIHPDHAFGLCVRFWIWCDENLSRSCHALVTRNSTLDAAIGRDGFASALIEVGWLNVRNGALVIPNFDRHLSQSSKERALAADRQQRNRVTKLSRSCHGARVTKSKSKSKSISSEGIPSSDISFALPQSLDCDSFKSAWADWLAYRQSLKPALKPQSIRQQLDRLAEFGHDAACAAIKASIANGWKGLFPENTRTTKGRTHANGPGQVYAGPDSLGEV